MTTAVGLEESYRRLLRWYPALYRRGHEEEIIGVLMATSRPEQRRPGARDSADLLWSGLKIRTRMALRGGRESWAAACGLAAVLTPLLMVLLRLTLLLGGGVRQGFGSPGDILIGAYGHPAEFAATFGLSHSAGVPDVVTQALTAGPLPALVLAVLACLGWRRAAAALAAFVPLAYLGVVLASGGYTLLGGPHAALTLYAYALEVLALLMASGAPRGWRALRWRPGALLAVITVAAGLGMNGGLWPLLHGRPTRLGPVIGSIQPGFIDRLVPIGPGYGWGDWLVYQGTLAAVIAVALAILLLSSPVSFRAVSLLAVPFALGAVIWLCSLVSTALPGSAGNAVTAAPLLLILLAAMAVPLVRGRSAGPGTPAGT